MPTSVRVVPEEQYVEVIHRETLTRAELEDSRARAAEMLAGHGLSRLLVDGRQADITALSSVEIFEFSAGHSSTLPSLVTLRMALVIPEEHAEQVRFAETVARNRGVNVRVFLDPDEARKWLAGGQG